VHLVRFYEHYSNIVVIPIRIVKISIFSACRCRPRAENSNFEQERRRAVISIAMAVIATSASEGLRYLQRGRSFQRLQPEQAVRRLIQTARNLTVQIPIPVRLPRVFQERS
jgi:hypothetical protein